MYKRHKIILLGIFLILFAYSFILDLQVSVSLLNSLLTIESILIVFVFIALSTLFGREFIKKLHSVEDEELKTKTSLQVLKSYFSMFIELILFNIVILILLLVLDKNFISGSNCHLILQRILFATILPLIFDSFYIMYLLIKNFLRFFEEEAKTNTTEK